MEGYRRYDDIVAWALDNPQYARRHPLSDVMEVSLAFYDGTNATITIGQVFGLLKRTMMPHTNNIAAVMGLLDFNRRQSPYVDLSYLSNCSFYLTLDLGASHGTIMELSKQWLDRVVFFNPTNQLRPMVVAGPTTSAHSEVASQLGASATHAETPLAVELDKSHLNIEGVLTMSSFATSSELDDADLFARTIPSNRGDAKAISVYLTSIGTRQLAVLYVNDAYGKSYMLDLFSAAHEHGITLHLFPFDIGVAGSLQAAGNQLRASDVRHVFGIVNNNDWQAIVSAMFDAKIMGNPDYAWFWSNSMNGPRLSSAGFVDHDLAVAINGSAVISILPPAETFAQFTSAMDASMHGTEFVRYFSSRLQAEEQENFTYGTEINSILTYEVMMAIGHAGCSMRFEDFNAPNLYERLRLSNYTGISGKVALDENGTRVADDMIYSIANLMTDESSEPGFYRITGRPALEIQTKLPNPIIERQPLLFASGTSTPPPNVRPVVVDENLVPLGIRAFIWVLAASVFLLAAFCVFWTGRNRNHPKVRASQPLFLILVCVGPMLVAVAVILITFQEPMPIAVLNGACMAHVWLLSVGFCLTFAVLFAKTWRINRVLQNAKKFRRVQVKPLDVLWPLCILLAVNVSILITWTVRAPLQWHRQVTMTDSLGQPIATVGTCYVNNGENWIYAGLLLIVNLVALVVSNYESFRARNLPSEFNESYLIAITNGILLEDLLLGIPVLFVVGGDPTILVLVSGVVATIFCLAVLLPIFVPKFQRSSEDEVQRRPGASSRASSSGTFLLSNNSTGTARRISGLSLPATPSSEFRPV